MMHISLDLLYVEKKLISLRVGDPRLQEILNVFQILGQELSEIILILKVILRANYKKLL